MQLVQRAENHLSDESSAAPSVTTEALFAQLDFDAYLRKAIGAKGTEQAYGIGILLADITGFCAAAVMGALAFMISAPGTSAQNLPVMPLAGAAATALLATIAFLSARDHYTYRIALARKLPDLALSSVVAVAAAASFAFLSGATTPRLPVLAAALAFAPLALAFRRVARMALKAAGCWNIPVVIVGEGDWAVRAAATLQAAPDLGYTVAGAVSPPYGSARLGSIPWKHILERHQARMLVFAFDCHARLPANLIASVVRERVPYALLPEQTGLPQAGVSRIRLSPDAVLVNYRNNLAKPVARATKIAFDLAVASVALVVLAPVMLIVAAAVGLDGGPVFYGHNRIGANGRNFRCLKFRSMVVDSDAALARLFAHDPAAQLEWARSHKLRNDPRVTWIGGILRKTSLDELPQLFNVLRLEMSLVGPRPIVSLEIPKYGEDIAFYYETRPGITGLWQVSGRSDTTYVQRVQLDSWYVKNWTLGRDLAIIARTIPAVISGRGAG